MENMTEYQYAWALYLVGACGCSLAAWLLFRRAGRALTHFFVITVMVILFTPYAIDAETMTMAPALYSLVFGYFDGGIASVRPVLKLMLGFWVGALILSLIYQLLTRHHSRESAAPSYHSNQGRTGYARDDQEEFNDSPVTRRSSRTNSNNGLSLEERIARDELLHEEPIRAVR